MEELKGIGIKSMSIIKSSRKKTLIPKIRDEMFEINTSKEQQDEEDCTDDEGKMTHHSKLKDSEEPNKKADTKELETRKRKVKAYFNSQNKKLKEGKSGDNDGTKVEDIKGCDEETKDDERNLQRRDNVQRYYTRCLEEGENEKGFKNSDVERADNYRPIRTLLTLY